MSGPVGFSTVLVFKHLEFDQKWTQVTFYNTPWFPYTASTDGATLTVIEEGATGVMMTYWFQLKKDQIVIVSLDENLVFIPDKCVKKEPGDHSSCKGK